jgi:myo-inositol-1(or 4)-monophosphatase
MGSAALDLAYVAAGRFDVYWEKRLNLWDMAAGILLVEEAGGLVTTPAGAPLRLQGTPDLLAGPPAIHAQLLAVLNGR